MRRALGVLLLGVLPVLFSGPVRVAAAAPVAEVRGAPAPSLEASAAARRVPPQLRRDGRWLVDPQGRVVIVHGVNLVYKRAPYVPPDGPTGFTRKDAAWLARHGFNAARVGTLWAGLTPDAPGRADPAYLDRWQRVLDLLARKRIWIQLDMHQDQWHEQ